MEAYISTNGQGGLVAEFTNEETFETITADLQDAGIDCYGYGETVPLPDVPQDVWELISMLRGEWE